MEATQPCYQAGKLQGGCGDSPTSLSSTERHPDPVDLPWGVTGGEGHGALWAEAAAFWLCLPEGVFSLVAESEEGKVRERNIHVRERHPPAASNPHPGVCPLGSEPVTFRCQGWCAMG